MKHNGLKLFSILTFSYKQHLVKNAAFEHLKFENIDKLCSMCLVLLCASISVFIYCCVRCVH